MLGGLVASAVSGGPQVDMARGTLVVTTAWAMVGLYVGIMSAWLEPQFSRKVAGAISGTLGGALGGGWDIKCMRV